VTSSLAPKEAELPASQIQCSSISTGSSLYIPPHSSRPDHSSCGRERPGPGPRPSISSAKIASYKDKFYDILHITSKNATELNWHLAGLYARLPGNPSSSGLGSSTLLFLSPLALPPHGSPMLPPGTLSAVFAPKKTRVLLHLLARPDLGAGPEYPPALSPARMPPRYASSHRPGAASAARHLLIFGRPPILPVPGPEKSSMSFCKITFKMS
jgi:hypothetical protein